MITIRRALGGSHIVVKDGANVGTIRKGSKSKGFFLQLDGYYWKTRATEPNQSGGSSARGGYLRMREAVAHAHRILGETQCS